MLRAAVRNLKYLEKSENLMRIGKWPPCFCPNPLSRSQKQLLNSRIAMGHKKDLTGGSRSLDTLSERL